MRKPMNVWERVIWTQGDCWLWVGPLNHAGYGTAGRKGRVHRWVYRQLIGPIPDGMTLDHLCRKRNCCNPLHLEAVSQRENTLRGTSPSSINALKTHCYKGHPFTPENTLIRERGSARCCRECNRQNQAAYRARQAAKRDAA